MRREGLPSWCVLGPGVCGARQRTSSQAHTHSHPPLGMATHCSGVSTRQGARQPLWGVKNAGNSSDPAWEWDGSACWMMACMVGGMLLMKEPGHMCGWVARGHSARARLLVHHSKWVGRVC